MCGLIDAAGATPLLGHGTKLRYSERPAPGENGCTRDDAAGGEFAPGFRTEAFFRASRIRTGVLMLGDWPLATLVRGRHESAVTRPDGYFSATIFYKRWSAKVVSLKEAHFLEIIKESARPAFIESLPAK